MAETGAAAVRRVDPIRWLQEWRTGGRVDFRIGRDGADLVAEWTGLCTVRMTRSGQVLRFMPADGVDAAKARRVLEGPVQGFARHLNGKVSLHASAVARGDAAVLLLGASTSGKSTLAAALCRSGFEMLADDAAFLEDRQGRYEILPSESILWLREDAARALGAEDANSSKRPLPPQAVANHPARLCLMVGLAFDDSAPRAGLRRLEGHEAFRWLRTSLFRLVIDEPDVDAMDFANVAALHVAAPLFEMRRRRCLAELQEGVGVILGAIDRLEQAGRTP